MLPFIDPGGIWHITYCIGLMLIVPFYVFNGPVRGLPLSAKLLFTYLLFWCLFILEYPAIHFGPFTPNFQSTAAQVFAESLLILYAVGALSKWIAYLIPVLALFASMCVWLGLPGLMHAPSFNAALAAACIPAIASPYLIGFIILTALAHHGSTALLILGAQLLALILKKRVKWEWLLWAGIAGIVSATLWQNQPHFNSGERLEKYAEYLHFWARDWKSVVFGMGPGSFVWYPIMRNLNNPEPTRIFLQMHSDYLEVLWALGLVGEVLAVAVCARAVKKAWGMSVEALAGVLGCLAFMLTYEPLEYFPSALLTAWFFARVLIIENVDLKFAGLVWPVKSND